MAAYSCSGAAASVMAGDFSCNISLNPGVNFVVVRAMDLAGNASQVNMHLTLDAPLPPPTSPQITSNGVNMQVGQTQQFLVMDDQGQVWSDASWSVDNTSLATLDSNTPALLTAVATGTVTLRASVGSVTATRCRRPLRPYRRT